MASVDAIVTDLDPVELGYDEPAICRVPTRPMHEGRTRVEIDLADHENAASFLETVAAIIRERRRIVIIIE